MQLDVAPLLPQTVLLSPRAPLTTGEQFRRVTHFPSRKNQEAVGCTALQHTGFCVHLEFNPSVKRYASRPCQIEFKKSGTLYRPDFCSVLSDSRVVFYELRRPTTVNLPCEKHRLTELRQLFSEAGLFFESIILTEACPPLLTGNLRYLYHHALKGTIDGAVAVRSHLLGQAICRVAVRDLLSAGHLPENVAYAIFYRIVIADLSHRFDLDTVVEVEPRALC